MPVSARSLATPTAARTCNPQPRNRHTPSKQRTENMATCKFTVRYSGDGFMHTAKFSDHDDAMRFARQYPFAEVSLTAGRGKGLVAQFDHGKATPEFAHLDVQPAS